MSDAVGNEILDYTQRAGKTYVFDHAHDETEPAQLWFQESDEGLTLFLVFYTQACRWSRCLGCNLPSKMSLEPVSYKAIIAQIDSVFRNTEVAARLHSIRQVIVSNNGSVLDQVTFSSTALMYLLAQLNLHVPNLSVLTIETRPEYVDVAELEFVSRAIAEGDTPTGLELAIGFEIFDDRLRNEVYHKGLDLATFARLAAEVAPYKFRLKCYFMLKPVPAMTDAQAIADIHNAIDYLARIAIQYGVGINMHLCPTYVAAGTPIETAFQEGRYTPPTLRDAAAAALHARDKKVSIYIATFDEGLAVEGGSFLRPSDEALVKEIERFNRTQDYDILQTIAGS